MPAEQGRQLAASIEGARFVELEGADNSLIAGDSDAVLDRVEEFLTGQRGAPIGDSILAHLRGVREPYTQGPPRYLAPTAPPRLTVELVE